MATKIRNIDTEITRRAVKVTGERLYTQAEVQAMLAEVLSLAAPAPKTVTKTAPKPAVKPMSAKREAVIREELSRNWWELVQLRKREGSAAEYASPLQARKQELKAELKAAGKHTKVEWKKY